MNKNGRIVALTYTELKQEPLRIFITVPVLVGPSISYLTRKYRRDFDDG